MQTLVRTPAWVVLLIFSVLCGSLALGVRLLLRRVLGDELPSAASVAGPLMPALGAVFALLAATSLGAEAAQFRSAGDDVSAEAAAASRMAWASTSPGVDSATIQKDLGAYLRSTRTYEWDGRHPAGDPRTMRTLAELERSVRESATSKTVGSAPATELLASLDALTSLRRQRLVTATSEMPALYLVVVLAAGLALVANSAALALTMRGRMAMLTAGLVIVVALALSLLVAISSPFEGGFLVGGRPVDAIRSELAAGSFRP